MATENKGVEGRIMEKDLDEQVVTEGVVSEKDMLYGTMYSAKLACLKAQKEIKALEKLDDETEDGVSNEQYNAAYEKYDEAFIAEQDAEFAYLEYVFANNKGADYSDEFSIMEESKLAMEAFKKAKEEMASLPQYDDEAFDAMSDDEVDDYLAKYENALYKVNDARSRNQAYALNVAELIKEFAKPMQFEETAEEEIEEQQENAAEAEEVKQTLAARILSRIKSPFQSFMNWYRAKREKKAIEEQTQDEVAVQTAEPTAEQGGSPASAIATPPVAEYSLEEMLERSSVNGAPAAGAAETPAVKEDAAEVVTKEGAKVGAETAAETTAETTAEEKAKETTEETTSETSEESIDEVVKEEVRDFEITKDKNFVFDVEGTLVYETGSLKPGVVELFDNIMKNVEEPTIVLLSSGSVEKGKKALSKIEEKLEMEIPATVVGYNGTVLYADEETSLSVPISKESFQAIAAAIAEIDPRAYVCALGEEGNFYKATGALTREEFKAAVYKMQGFGKIAKETSPQNLEQMLDDGKFNAIAVVPYNKNAKQKIANALSELNVEGMPKKAVVNGGVILVEQRDKWDFMQSYFTEEDLKETAYFGDGLSDMNCLKNVEDSFAVGNNLRVMEAGKLPMKDLNSANAILFEGRSPDLHLLTRCLDYDLVKRQRKEDQKAEKRANKQTKYDEQGSVFARIKAFFVGKKKEEAVAEETAEVPTEETVEVTEAPAPSVMAA